MKTYTITVNGTAYDVTVEEGTGSAKTYSTKGSSEGKAPKAAQKQPEGKEVQVPLK